MAEKYIWEDPKKVHINKEKGHTIMMPLTVLRMLFRGMNLSISKVLTENGNSTGREVSLLCPRVMKKLILMIRHGVI